MKVTTWVEHSEEIEIDISTEDIQRALLGGEDVYGDVCIGLNNFATFIKAVSGDVLAQFTEKQKKTIREFLIKQSKRFA